MKYKIMEYDDVLKLYEADLDLRVNDYHKKKGGTYWRKWINCGFCQWT